MMKRAMELKQNKNLETFKGNSFAALQFDNLNPISCDTNIKIGNHNLEINKIIDDMIKVEQKNYQKFMGQSPEIIFLKES
jgi:hypothetical protein